jgi:hypothetical protein
LKNAVPDQRALFCLPASRRVFGISMLFDESSLDMKIPKVLHYLLHAQ